MPTGPKLNDVAVGYLGVQVAGWGVFCVFNPQILVGEGELPRGDFFFGAKFGDD